MVESNSDQDTHLLRHQATRLRLAALAGVKTVTVEIRLPQSAAGADAAAGDARLVAMELPIANMLAMLHSRLSQIETQAGFTSPDDVEFL